MKLKEFKNTDIFIVGTELVDENDKFYSDVLITDDEHTFVITVDNEIKHRLTSDGFISILTKEEFKKQKYHISEELIDKDFIYLPNFTGTIGVKVVFIMNKPTPNIHITDLDLNTYLMHQSNFDKYFNDKNYYDVEYCITLPTNTNIEYIECDDEEEIINYIDEK